MADIRNVTGTFAVAPQLRIEDFPELKALGFTHVIGNRPDSEVAGDEPTGAEARAAAGISEGLLRVAVGLEAVEDLQADLDRGLSLN